MTETIINTNMIVMSGKEEEILMTMTIGIVGNRGEQNRTGENRGEGPDQRVAVVAQGETDHTPHVWRYCHRHHNLCCVSCFPNVVTKISIFSKAINGVNPRCSQNLLSNKANEKYKEPKKPTSKDQS